MGIGKLDSKFNRLIITNFIITILILTFVKFGNETNISPTELQNKYWLPSTVMQSVAAIYAVFIAIFILTIQRHQIKISSVANVLKPQFELVSYIIITVLWFNGLILSCLSYFDFEESKVNILLILSSISLFVSLFAIVNFSFKILSNKAGLITPEEFLIQIEEDEDKLKEYSESDPLIEGMVYSLRKQMPDDLDKFRSYMNSTAYKKLELVESYIEILNTHENHLVRAGVANLFGNTKIKESVDPLIEKLDDNYAIVRQYSADALGEINDLRAVKPLIQVLINDSEVDVRKSSAEALGKIYDTRAFESQDSSSSANGSILLGKINNSMAVDPLIQALTTDKYGSVRQSSAKALDEINDPRAVSSLIDALDDTYAGVRSTAARALGNFNDVRAVDPLIERLKDTDRLVRRSAALALGNFYEVKAVDPLIERLKDVDRLVRRNAAKSIGNILDKDAVYSNNQTLNNELIEEAVNSFISIMINNIYEVAERISAAEALIKINHIKSVDPFIRSLNDNDLIKYSAIALGKIKDRRAIKPLIKILNDNNYDYAKNVNIYNLRKNNISGEFLKKTNKIIKSELVYALGEFRDESAVKPIIRCLNDNDGNVVIDSAIALGKIKNTKATKPLIKKLNKNNFVFAKSDLEDCSDENGISIIDCRILFIQNIRSQIAEALGEIGDEMAFKPLMKIINNNKEDDDVRRAAGMAIRKIKGEDWFRQFLKERSDIYDLIVEKE